MKISTLKLLEAMVGKSIGDIVNNIKRIDKKKIATFGLPAGAFTAYAISNIINPPACYASVNETKPSLFERIVQKTKFKGEIGFSGEINGEEVSTDEYSQQTSGKGFSLSPKLDMSSDFSKIFFIGSSVEGKFKQREYSEPKDSGYKGNEYFAEIHLGVNLSDKLAFEIGPERRWENDTVTYSNLKTKIKQDLHGISAGLRFKGDELESSLSYHQLKGKEEINSGVWSEKMDVKMQELKAEIKAYLESFIPYLSIVFTNTKLPKHEYRDSKKSEITGKVEIPLNETWSLIGEGSYGVMTLSGINNRNWVLGLGFKADLK